MAAIYGQKYFWNITFKEEIEELKEILPGYFTDLTLVFGIALLVLGLVIMVANAIVIAAIWKDPYKQLRSSPSNIIIASMACCDFLVGLESVSIQGLWFFSMSLDLTIAGLVYAIAYATGVLLVGVSVLHILALTIDRILAVSSPFLYKSRVTRRRVKFLVLIIWFFCVLFVIVNIPVYNRYYILSVISMTFFTSVGSPVIFLSILIIYYVRKHTKELRKNKEFNTKRTIIERDGKTTKSILIILVFYFACFNPFFISWVVFFACSSCQSHLSQVLTCFYASYVLIYVNSAVNPFLYAFRLPKFRKPVVWIAKRMFICRFSSILTDGLSEDESSSKTSQNEHKVRPLLERH